MTKKILLATLAAATLAACGSDSSNNNNNTCTGTPFVQPAGTVPVNFSVDDTANKLFSAGELSWKGAMLYNSTTRIITADSTWGGPFAKLYDDGPWNCGGHEPAGATASDNKWGVTVFLAPPATGSTTIEYGLVDQLYETNFGNGWMWVGANGSFKVDAGATAAVTAQGLTVPAVGTVDFKLALNKAQLSAGTWSTTTVKVKSSAWGWSEITLADDGTKGDTTAGDGIYTMQLSNWAGAGKPYKHSGLLKSGQTAEFIWVLNGVEYKLASGNAATGGVTASTKASTATAFTDQTISILANKNSAITVP